MENYSVNQVKRELLQIRKQVEYLMRCLQRLEAKVEGIPGPERAEAPAPEIKTESPGIVEPEKKTKSEGLEIDMGRFWLNRIGIVIFTLGIGFLISYVFKSFGPLAKIIFSYLIGACLFFAGLKFQKNEKFINYGRVLLGGAWAIIYFTTFAMYHFEAARVINSQLLDLLLLAAVAAGIIWHSLRYHSEELCSVAILVGYLTATLGNVNYFTFLSCLILAVTSVFLLYRMQWVKLIFLGIVFTYTAHFFWVYRHITNSTVVLGNLYPDKGYFLLNFGFILMYWAVFVLGIHLIKPAQTNKVLRGISSANFMNFLLFFFMAYGELSRLYPAYRFTFILGFGIIYLGIAFVMEKLKNRSLFTSDILVAISLLTLAIPLKFLPFHTSLIWMVELPFLMLIGVIFDRKVFRYFGNVLLLLLFFKIYFIDFNFYNAGSVRILGYVFSWEKIISLIGFISMSACFYILKYSRYAKQAVYSEPEKQLFNFSSAFSALYLGIFIFLAIDSKWITPALSLEALIFFLLGCLLADRPLRIYALLGALMVFLRSCFFESYQLTYYNLRTLVLIMELAPLYAIYFLYRNMKARNNSFEGETQCFSALFYAAAFMFTSMIFSYVPEQWISLGLGLEGVILFISGFLLNDKPFRLAGFVVFALTLLRIIFVDLAMLAVIYKIASFIILGLIFLAVSFIYTKYNIKKV